jgi:uncharacterized protein
MSEFAIWRRLDLPGHDAARLSRAGDGWDLKGTAVFKHELGPACIEYAVNVDSAWRTRRAAVRGFVQRLSMDHEIVHAREGWYLDGKLMKGLSHLSDIDFGFTPATNTLQLRRVAISPGQEVELPVAWLDLGAAALTELPQRYRRIDERTYDYAAPSVGYTGRLELLENGFIKTYPTLWEAQM